MTMTEPSEITELGWLNAQGNCEEKWIVFVPEMNDEQLDIGDAIKPELIV